MLNSIIRFVAIVLFGSRKMYWTYTQRIAEKQKPKVKVTSFYHSISYLVWLSVNIIVFVQLLGIPMLPMQKNILWWQIVGLSLMSVGLLISIWARKTLGTNWANGYEYQIKKGQELVTTGIYSSIRHPIYLGLTLSYVGAEMVSGSWLWVSFLACFIAFYFQGRREEKILIAHFGKSYTEYMQHTKMLIPYIL